MKLLFLQVFPGPGGDNALEDKDEGGENDEALGTDQVASESFNRSSSFLFDSLYDSSLLAGLSPHQNLDQSDEGDSGEQEIRGKCFLRTTQDRRRSELLANQEAEQQEAIQWGESSFSLSEWGDSLLVGEHFLERQSFLKHTERTHEEQGANQCQDQQPNAHVLSEEQMSEPQPKPSQAKPQLATTSTTTTQAEYDEHKACNNQSDTHKMNQHNNAQNDNKLSRGQEKKIKEGEEMSVLLSDKAVVKRPHVQNPPESTFYCSPGLQEIFDRWPSMSDQLWQNATTSHAANTAEFPDLPQPSRQVTSKVGDVQIAPSDRDSQGEQPLRHDGEDGTERQDFAADLIPPTQEMPPVTPRVKLTTSSVQSPLTAQPLTKSTPSTMANRPKFFSGRSHCLSDVDANTKDPKSTTDHSHKHQLGQKIKALHVAHSNSKTKPQRHTEQNLSPRRDCAPSSSLRPKLPLDVESPVIDEGFTLQLSQDVSVSSSNSGTFSIIDVASDRRLFETFIKEWKTKERYSLALACEKREQQPEGEIGGKHKRGM